MQVILSKRHAHRVLCLAGRARAGAIALAGFSAPCLAETADLKDRTIGITGGRANDAPCQAPLTVVQPTSVIDRTFIENAITSTSNVDKIARVLPSVATSPSDNGGSDARFQSDTAGGSRTQRVRLDLLSLQIGERGLPDRSPSKPLGAR
ncbi:hypothetical protein [Bradyrhizobium iriomotense]|uniref:TonB-dependent receptor plug domain-containing protein n=1 Tax=Bradyrhizobium iriomotense TaxID=441950 RepID=A0ABQ6AZH9_9BRAD|nr:hypothetical protein [Bradyrhizobium iriomotense]GLR87599.1 hypothetical protein GCM10007857_43100 [Bradyrhizobium iriomotense]